MVQKCSRSDVSRVYHRVRSVAILDAGVGVETAEAVAAEQARRGVVERFVGVVPVVFRRVRFYRIV